MTLVGSLVGTTKAFAGLHAPARRHEKTCVERASHDMLQLYRTNLDVRLQSMNEADMSEHQKQIAAKIADMFRASGQARATDNGFEWDEAYKAERLSALLFNGAQLRQEIASRLGELADQKVPEGDRFRQEYEALTAPARDGQVPATEDGVLRALLLRMIEALQWTAKRRYLERPIRKAATKKILAGLLVAFVMMLIPYLALSFNYKPESGHVSWWWSHLGLYTAMNAGALGAFFSRLIMLQRDWPKMSLEEMCFHSEWSYALLRAGVGMCGALILFYFFQAGLIDGSVFPHVGKFAINLVSVEPPAVHMAFATPSHDLALLTVWCLLGGFSEVLVPGLLAKTEGQFSQADGPVKAR